MVKSYFLPVFLLVLSIICSACTNKDAMETASVQESEEHSLPDAEWQAKQIADALRAAPPGVTKSASIYAWTEEGERVLVRQGEGPYTCVASGSYSLRVGKPPLPYPDPLCADPNAWAFIKAFWSDPDPMNPRSPLPDAPGVVWMLGGMNIAKGLVAYGTDNESLVQTGQAAEDSEEVINMTPHIMILPLAVDPEAAGLAGAYAPDEPHRQWVMAAGTPVAHLHVHFSDSLHRALMAVGK